MLEGSPGPCAHQNVLATEQYFSNQNFKNITTQCNFLLLESARNWIFNYFVAYLFLFHISFFMYTIPPFHVADAITGARKFLLVFY